VHSWSLGDVTQVTMGTTLRTTTFIGNKAPVCLQDSENVDQPGNLLPSIFCGSRLYFIRKSSKYEKDIKPKQELLAKQLL